MVQCELNRGWREVGRQNMPFFQVLMIICNILYQRNMSLKTKSFIPLFYWNCNRYIIIWMRQKADSLSGWKRRISMLQLSYLSVGPPMLMSLKWRTHCPRLVTSKKLPESHPVFGDTYPGIQLLNYEELFCWIHQEFCHRLYLQQEHIVGVLWI